GCRCLRTDILFLQVRQGQLIVNGVAQNEHYTAPHGGSYMMEAMVQRYLYTQTPMGHYYTNK
uniref:Uncharacterized protein n=1 Tax=Aegilops tauschii subsp. strangulata TaxID=200361 RepID=A0A453T0L7_AEGTS